MWHTVSTIFKRKGEEGQNKKIFCKKWKEEIASQLGAHRHTQEKIEKFFWIL